MNMFIDVEEHIYSVCIGRIFAGVHLAYPIGHFRLYTWADNHRCWGINLGLVGFHLRILRPRN